VTDIACYSSLRLCTGHATTFATDAYRSGEAINRSGGKLSSIEDVEIIEAIVRRDPDALANLYSRYSSMLAALAHRVLGDASDAEEVLQETFFQVWNQAERYDRSRSSVSTWLVLITRSRAIDRLRSRQVVQRTAVAAQREKTDLHTSPEGVGHVLNEERGKRLNEAMSELPPEQRDVLELAFYKGLTQSEIAERSGIPLGTVKTRTLLAMKKLRKALEEELEELL
jgi:RNA polymerase sigma-70 factor (ECF subfamily)